MKYCDLCLYQPDPMLHPMQRFIREENVVQHEELVAWNLQPGAATEYELFYVEATDLDRYLYEIERVDSIRWHRAARIDETSLYVFICQETREEDVVLRRAFGRLELVIVPPIVYNHEAAMEMTIIGQETGLGTLVENIPGKIDVTIEEIGEYDRPNAGITNSVTDRQFEILNTAVELGYYDVPRTASLAVVATELDCAKSTVSVSLRTAEAAIITSIVDGKR